MVSGVILRIGEAMIKMNNNIVNMDNLKLQPQLETIKKHSFIHCLQHKCAICGIKIGKEERYYVALTSFNMIHAYHLEGVDMK